MKKSVLVCALFIVQAQLFAQTIPNVGFESWQSTPYDEPTGWVSSNRESFRHVGAANSTRVTGQSGDAIRLETMISNGDTAGAFVVNTEGDPLSGKGGVPYSQTPTSINGYYKYAPVGSDAAILLVIFKKAGSIIDTSIFTLGAAANFTSFSFPISFQVPITPDSVIIGAASSNLVGGVGIADGSVLILDELSFGGTTQAIPNGNFQNWTAKSFDRLNGWDVAGEGIARTNDKHSGTYAVMLQTFESGDGNVSPTQITSGTYQDNGPQKGGQPYSRQIDTLVGFYKYSGTADSAQIDVQLKKNGSSINMFHLRLGPAATYTAFSLPLVSGQAPDTIIINISSSKWPTSSSAEGSTLTIDGVQLASEVVAGIDKGNDRSFRITAFPNPATDKLTLILGEKKTGTLNIYDMAGKKRMSQTVNGRMLDLDIQSLNSGMYFYELATDNGEIARDRFIKQ